VDVGLPVGLESTDCRIRSRWEEDMMSVVGHSE
jgi:hypothetical protein